MSQLHSATERTTMREVPRHVGIDLDPWQRLRKRCVYGLAMSFLFACGSSSTELADARGSTSSTSVGSAGKGTSSGSAGPETGEGTSRISGVASSTSDSGATTGETEIGGGSEDTGSSTGASWEWGWTEILEGTAGNDQVLGVAVTSKGDTVWTGAVSGPWQEGAWQGAADIAFGIIAPSGEIVAELQLGSDGMDLPLDVVVLANGGFAIGGTTTGELFGEPNDDFNDGFVIGLTPGGEVAWTRRLGLGGVNQVAATPDGGVVAVGSAPGPGGGQAFAVELGAGGEFLWTSLFGDPGFSSATDAVAVDGDMIVIGFTTAGFDGEPASAGLDAFITRVERPSGNRVNTTLLTGPEDEALLRIVLADDVLWATGYTSSELDPEGAGAGVDVLLTRIGKDTTVGTVHQYGTAGDESPYGIAVDGDLVVVSGRIDDAAWNGRTALGGGDAFLLGIDAKTGLLEWSEQEGGPGRDEHVSVALFQDMLVTAGYQGQDNNGVLGDLWLTARPLR